MWPTIVRSKHPIQSMLLQSVQDKEMVIAAQDKCVEVFLTRLFTAFYRITTQRIISLTHIILGEY